MKRIYWILLGFYPAEYRALFANEMLMLFEEAAAERRVVRSFGFPFANSRDWCGAAVLNGLRSGAGRIDTSISRARGRTGSSFLIRRMEYAIAHHQFANARYYAEEERRERERLQTKSD